MAKFKISYEQVRTEANNEENRAKFVRPTISAHCLRMLRTIALILGLLFHENQMQDYKLVFFKRQRYDLGNTCLDNNIRYG